ncbi:MAG: tetratricopeptide repeat protein [Xenococcaceae cyanobacterium]
MEYLWEKSQKALEFYNQALPILREVGDRPGEAITLSNIGFVYRNTNQPTQAITTWKQSVEITLEVR